MSNEQLDELLDRSYPSLNTMLFYGAGLFSVAFLEKHIGFAGAAAIAVATSIAKSFFGGRISKLLWGNKTSDVKITIENDTRLNAELMTVGKSKATYPVKTTLTELEQSITTQLKKLIKPSELLGGEGEAEVKRKIEAYTHDLAQAAISRYPKLFYLDDRRKVQEPDYSNHTDGLMEVTVSKRKRK